MNDLIKWSSKTPANEIVPKTRKALADGMDWDTTLEFERAARKHQRAAFIDKANDHVQALKEAEVWIGRNLGEQLNEMEKSKGGSTYHKKSTGISEIPVLLTYKELGITKLRASRFSRVAKVDEKTVEQIIEKTPTITAVLKATKPKPPEPKPSKSKKKGELVSLTPAVQETIKTLLHLLIQKEVISITSLNTYGMT